jgi:polyisoprenoid-binding protein YceI
MSTRTIAWAALLAALAAPAFAQQRVNAVDLAKSEIRFVSRQMSVPVEGLFRRFTAQLEFDPARLADSKARVEVDLGSIDTGSTEADTEVKTKGWFNVAAFPKATFVSSSVKALGPNRYEAAGKLSIKGRSVDVTMPFTTRQDGPNTVFEGAFTLLRLQFNIGEGPWSDEDTVANAVQVRVRLLGVNKKS